MSYDPIKTTFQTGFEQHAERNGQPFRIVGYIDTPDDEHDEESLPMFLVEFFDGQTIEAWPYEVFAHPGSGMDA